jgi:NAD(P)-dependent dehydrogenase (short-subunit alcohol dehydrogenase family)
MNELVGNVAIITGGSGGIGFGIAQRFAQEGAKVLIADIDERAGNEAVAQLGPNSAFKRTDVSDQQQLREAVDFAVATFGGLDIMINNAGIGGARHPRLLDDDLADFHQVMAIDLLGVMAGTREAARYMSEHGGGSIVNISSIGGIVPSAGNWTYHVAKSSVVMFTKCAAIDLGEHNIRVNCIAPGNIETSILGRNMGKDVPPEKQAEFTASVRQFIISRQPLKKQGKVDDIAEATMFFVTDRSRYVTGTLLPVDGGLVAGSPNSKSSGVEALKKETAPA